MTAPRKKAGSRKKVSELVRGVGLEPTSLAASGPKPGAFANFASRAIDGEHFLIYAEKPEIAIGFRRIYGPDGTNPAGCEKIMKISGPELWK